VEVRHILGAPQISLSFHCKDSRCLIPLLRSTMFNLRRRRTDGIPVIIRCSVSISPGLAATSASKERLMYPKIFESVGLRTVELKQASN